ncbi:hypothetical protein AB0C12_12610 [Actinoplanes sp. NPDC048967]|uniref:hypothetical protein n=1 Tax=Actinoplanes sp. NPDC048967 TaxID=3155269 RepID=UPI0033C57EF4
MNVRTAWSIIAFVACVLLMAAAITTAAVLGSAAGVVLAVAVGTLVLSYIVRHEARMARIYRRRG